MLRFWSQLRLVRPSSTLEDTPSDSLGWLLAAVLAVPRGLLPTAQDLLGRLRPSRRRSAEPKIAPAE